MMDFDFMLLYEIIWLAMGVFFAGYLIKQWIKQRRQRQNK